VRERSSQSVSTHVQLEEHACVFEDRVEKDRRRSRRLSKCLKVKELRTTTGDLLSSRTLPKQ